MNTRRALIGVCNSVNKGTKDRRRGSVSVVSAVEVAKEGEADVAGDVGRVSLLLPWEKATCPKDPVMAGSPVPARAPAIGGDMPTSRSSWLNDVSEA